VKKHKHEGEIFLLDDSKGCYVEVYHSEKKDEAIGRVGVALGNGTDTKPYAWDFFQLASGDWAYHAQVTPDGFSSGPTISTVEEGLNQICGVYLRQLRELREREAFKPEAACDALHKYVGELPDPD
jgi:hypothetical protein